MPSPHQETVEAAPDLEQNAVDDGSRLEDGVAVMTEELPAPADDAAAGRDGTLAIQGGVVVFQPAEGGGKHPVIVPGPHVRVYVNGHPVTGERPVLPGSHIKVELLHQQPELRVDVRVSPDRLTAYMKAERQPGIRYELPDIPPTSRLVVSGRVAGVSPAPPVNEAVLRAKLAAHGIVFGIDPDALTLVTRRALRRSEGEDDMVVVARGIPPTPPVDDTLEFMFEQEDRRRAVEETDPGQVDLLGLFELVSVNPGDVVAVFHQGRPGMDGTDVYGKPIPVNKPRKLAVRAGRGVTVDESKTRYIANRGGRPSYRRGRIDIRTLHRVNGNLDLSEGHVNFTGDVIVRGSVMDQLRVVSEGKVLVYRSITGARVIAKEGVHAREGIYRSQVFAGTGVTSLPEYVYSLEQLCTALRQMYETVVRLKANPPFPMPGQKPVSDRELVQRLLVQRFPFIVPRLEQSLALLERRVWPEEVQPNGLLLALQQAHRVLSGRDRHYLTSASDLRILLERLQEAVDELSQQPATPANVVSALVHNATIHATGKIVITEGQCLYSHLVAGSGVTIQPGTFRAGNITVMQGDVVLGEAGSPLEVGRVKIEIVENGVFRAAHVHPGVELTIGGQTYTFMEPVTGVRASLKDGELVVES